MVFPIGVLPGWLQWFRLSLPPTYWLEGIRRTLLGVPPEGLFQSPLTGWDHGDLALALIGSTLALSMFAVWFFRWSEKGLAQWSDRRDDRSLIGVSSSQNSIVAVISIPVSCVVSAAVSIMLALSALSFSPVGVFRAGHERHDSCCEKSKCGK